MRTWRRRRWTNGPTTPSGSRISINQAVSLSTSCRILKDWSHAVKADDVGNCISILLIVVVAASALGGPGESYVKRSFEQQQRLHETGRSSAVPKMLSDDTLFASAMAATPANRTGKRPVAAYRNGASGWAWSRGAMDALFQKCRDVGIRFAAGQVNSLIIEGSDVRGARTMDGREFRAEELVVLAAGSWTPAILPDLTRKLKATGQVLATIQLTQEEAEVYKRIVRSFFFFGGHNNPQLWPCSLCISICSLAFICFRPMTKGSSRWRFISKDTSMSSLR